MRVGLWSVDDNNVPVRLEQRGDFLEVDLESWIHAHSELVLDGLQWVGRQVTLPGRPRIDLVGVTREGQLVIAEVKRGIVDIATLTQAMFYALSVASMDPDVFLSRLRLDDETGDLLRSGIQAEGQFDMSLMLIGTARTPELESASEFLASRGLDLPVSIVTLSTFVDAVGRVFLARETTEQEPSDDEASPRQRNSRRARVEWVQERARELGVGEVIEESIVMAGELGLKVRPWPKSLTIVPGTGMMKSLLYVGVKEQGLVGVGYSADTIASLYGGDERDVEAALGENWVGLTPHEARGRLEAFANLMSKLLEASEEPDG